MVTGVQRADTEYREPVFSHSPGRFAANSTAPKGAAKLKAKFAHAVGTIVRLKPTATHVLTGRSEKDRPVLDTVLRQSRDFPFEPFANLRRRKRPTR
jgi:hypothetical protein